MEIGLGIVRRREQVLGLVLYCFKFGLELVLRLNKIWFGNGVIRFGSGFDTFSI